MRSIKIISLLIMIQFLTGCNNDDTTENENENQVESIVSEIDNNIMAQWTPQMLELEQFSSGRPNGIAIALAYMYLATYETAVSGMPNYVSNTVRLNGLNIDFTQKADIVHWEISLNSCMATVTDHFLRNIPALHIKIGS